MIFNNSITPSKENPNPKSPVLNNSATILNNSTSILNPITNSDPFHHLDFQPQQQHGEQQQQQSTNSKLTNHLGQSLEEPSQSFRIQTYKTNISTNLSRNFSPAINASPQKTHDKHKKSKNRIVFKLNPSTGMHDIGNFNEEKVDGKCTRDDVKMFFDEIYKSTNKISFVRMKARFLTLMCISIGIVITMGGLSCLIANTSLHYTDFLHQPLFYAFIVLIIGGITIILGGLFIIPFVILKTLMLKCKMDIDTIISKHSKHFTIEGLHWECPHSNDLKLELWLDYKTKSSKHVKDMTSITISGKREETIEEETRKTMEKETAKGINIDLPVYTITQGNINNTTSFRQLMNDQPMNFDEKLQEKMDNELIENNTKVDSEPNHYNITDGNIPDTEIKKVN